MTDDVPLQVCRQPEYKPRPGSPSVWESRDYEKSGRAARERSARLLCLNCPALDWCEDRLSRYEQDNVFIDGIVAGRYSDSPKAKSLSQPYQNSCRACGGRLIAQAVWRAEPEMEPESHHLGEGLCRKCYPEFSRTARAVINHRKKL